MININYLDSSIICQEWARRLDNGTWNCHSTLFTTTKFRLYTVCYGGDGTALSSPTSKRGQRQRESIKYEVPDVKLARVMEQRIFSGQRYAYNEFMRYVIPAYNRHSFVHIISDSKETDWERRFKEKYRR